MNPAAWRVKDYADGWIEFATGEAALSEVAVMGGAMIEPVFPPETSQSADAARSAHRDRSNVADPGRTQNPPHGEV